MITAFDVDDVPPPIPSSCLRYSSSGAPIAAASTSSQVSPEGMTPSDCAKPPMNPIKGPVAATLE